MEGQKSRDARDLIEKLQRVDCIMHRKLWRQLNLKEKPGYVMILAKLLKATKASPEGLRISDLASAFDVTASSVTQMVTGLEERGLVGRNMAPRASSTAVSETRTSSPHRPLGMPCSR